MKFSKGRLRFVVSNQNIQEKLIKNVNVDVCMLVFDPVVSSLCIWQVRGPEGFTGMPSSGQLACKILSQDQGFLADIWQKCVFSENTFYFILSFWLSDVCWVLIINISHTCSPAVGRKLSTFVFSRRKKRSHRSEIKEMKPAAIQSETFAQNPSEEECSWKWRKSGKTTVMLLRPPPGCRSSPSPQPYNQECVDKPRF